MGHLSWCSRRSLRLLFWEAPRIGEYAELGLDCVGLPIIATVARLLCHTGRIRGGPSSDSQPRGSRSRGVAGGVGSGSLPG